jgi:4-amino-4-deoxy-L-arabinose transferase-like glycosyltransferase
VNILNKEKYHIWILLGLCLILFFWNINIIPLTDGDSAFYAKIAKNIVQSGDWITMHYGDEGTIVNKPPLMMWMTAASFKLFGFNDFAVSFWHSIFALLIVIFSYKLAKELYDSKTAFISSLILITASQFFYQARSPLQDVPLTLFMLLSIYCFVLYEKRNDLLYFYLSPIFIALAVLTKGPVGLVLPALIILIYVLINKIKLPSIRHILLAILLFSAVALPWFIIEYKILGQPFLDTFIGSNIGRYLKPIDTIGNESAKYSAIKPQYDFYSYFLQILLLFLPWSGFLYPALYYSYNKKENNLAMIFAATVFIFFSLSLNYKISRYILPAFPALSILVGKMISDLLFHNDKQAKKLVKLSAWITLTVILIPVCVLSLFYAYVAFSSMSGVITLIFIPFISVFMLSILVGYLAAILGHLKQSFILLVVLTVISYLLLINGLSGHYMKMNPISKFCEQMNNMAKPSDIACQYMGTDAHFMIYYSNLDVKFIRDEQEMKRLLSSANKVYCVSGDRTAYNLLKKSLGERIKVIEDSDYFTFFSN